MYWCCFPQTFRPTYANPQHMSWTCNNHQYQTTKLVMSEDETLKSLEIPVWLDTNILMSKIILIYWITAKSNMYTKKGWIFNWMIFLYSWLFSLWHSILDVKTFRSKATSSNICFICFWCWKLEQVLLVFNEIWHTSHRNICFTQFYFPI